MTPSVLDLLLGCFTALLGLAAFAAPLARQRWSTPLVYAGCLAICLAAGGLALRYLLTAAQASDTTILPLGLPWVGARFRLDALAAVFLVVVNLGAAAASLYALGYGRHEPEPQRVLPFYPVFLAGMNLVVLANDAFSFLVVWEVMSLSSWALVMARHRDAENVRAGDSCLLMAR